MALNTISKMYHFNAFDNTNTFSTTSILYASDSEMYYGVGTTSNAHAAAIIRLNPSTDSNSWITKLNSWEIAKDLETATHAICMTTTHVYLHLGLNGQTKENNYMMKI